MKRSKITHYVASNTVKTNILTLIWSMQSIALPLVYAGGSKRMKNGNAGPL